MWDAALCHAGNNKTPPPYSWGFLHRSAWQKVIPYAVGSVLLSTCGLKVHQVLFASANAGVTEDFESLHWLTWISIEVELLCGVGLFLGVRPRLFRRLTQALFAIFLA